MQTQNNTNSGEKQNGAFVTPKALIEINQGGFLMDLLEEPSGIIRAKNLLNEVFTTFFVSDGFVCHREFERAEYIMLFENLQNWVDVCHSEILTSQAEAEAARQLEVLETMREKLLTNKKSCRN